MLVYWFLPNRYRNIFCFLASLFFYAWGEPTYVFLMLLSIYVNYKLGLGLEKREDQAYRNRILGLGVVFNIGLLVVFKYTGFILGNVKSWFNLDFQIPAIRLPLGISFFTFQALSYLIDVYRGDARVQKSFMKLGLYISAFPQLVAGPIVRYNTVMDQIENRELSLDKISYGLLRFSTGLGKKVLLSNSFGLIADNLFKTNHLPLGAGAAWLGAVFYTLQIYYDFSGYSDMAIGLGSMLAFEYEENFNYPYISRSITEFWRRWHISLGTWFKDYLYIPLGGNRCSRIKNLRNLFLVWLATGFWHGAEWNFIAWGLYYFLLIAIERYIIKDLHLPRFLEHGLTIVFFTLGAVLFRSPSLAYAKDYIAIMFGLKKGSLYHDNILVLRDNWYLLLAGIIGATPLVRNIALRVWERYRDRDLLVVCMSVFLCALLLLSTLSLVNSSYNPFIYFRF